MKIASALLLALAPLTAAAQIPELGANGYHRDRLDTLHRGLDTYVDEGKHSGLISLLIHDGKIVDVHTSGHRDAENDLPMQRDTICRIYSMSKIITSVAALTLVENGTISLDDKLSNFVPGFTQPKVLESTPTGSASLVDANNSITVRHLLTHTSGLIYGFLDSTGPIGKQYNDAGIWAIPTLEEFSEKIATLPLADHPGTRYHYSVSTDILGRVIEVASGMPFDDYLQKTIFTPLEMNDTAFFVPADKRDRLAVIYQHGDDGKLTPAPAMLGADSAEDVGFPSGGGGLFSTIDDYARFALMLLNNGQLDGKVILGRKTVELMTTVNHLATIGTGTHQFSEAHGWGLGVEIRTRLDRGASPGSIGQYGWSGAASTHLNIDKNERTISLLFCQHFPFNEHGIFEKFHTLTYSALK